MSTTYGLYNLSTKKWIDLGKPIYSEKKFQASPYRIVEFLIDSISCDLTIIGDDRDVVDAIKFVATNENFEELLKLYPKLIWHTNHSVLSLMNESFGFTIDTAKVGDWIIKEENGKVYVLKEDEFRETFEYCGYHDVQEYYKDNFIR
jgi:hypothetical protein